MEPSSMEELQVELFRLLRASRREATYVPLHVLAKLIAEALDVGEHVLLADLLVEYEAERLAADERA